MIRDDLGKIALVLPGGGSRGIRQIGMVRAFMEAGLDYHALYGTSVGSLNGAMIHQGGVSAAIDLWMQIRTSQIYRRSWRSLIMPWMENPAIYDMSPLRTLLKTFVNYEAVASNPKPFTINTTDIKNGVPYSRRASELSKEDFFAFLHASAAPPVMFEPIQLHNRVLVDGGLINNASIQEAVIEGADTLFILGPSPASRYSVHNIKDMIDRVLYVAMEYHTDRELDFVQYRNEMEAERQIKMVYVRPDLKTDFGFLDFDFKGMDRHAIMEEGREIMARAIRLAFDEGDYGSADTVSQIQTLRVRYQPTKVS